MKKTPKIVLPMEEVQREEIHQRLVTTRLTYLSCPAAAGGVFADGVAAYSGAELEAGAGGTGLDSSAFNLRRRSIIS